MPIKSQMFFASASFEPLRMRTSQFRPFASFTSREHGTRCRPCSSLTDTVRETDCPSIESFQGTPSESSSTSRELRPSTRHRESAELIVVRLVQQREHVILGLCLFQKVAEVLIPQMPRNVLQSAKVVSRTIRRRDQQE